ncbi:MAG: hypothetical protein GY820_27815 [Gammaproteobacteria bacterium]|nr:hypothetical protein [Gammaproteobacteria bacterium]
MLIPIRNFKKRIIRYPARCGTFSNADSSKAHIGPLQMPQSAEQIRPESGQRWW